MRQHDTVTLPALLLAIQASGLSVRRVCRAAGVNPSVVSRWKSGKVEPRLSSLRRVAAALARLQAEEGV